MQDTFARARTRPKGQAHDDRAYILYTSTGEPLGSGTPQKFGHWF